jgi:probable HAF family extracellular repeat protein
MRPFPSIFLGALCAAALPLAAWGQSHYSVSQLPALGGSFSAGNSVDDLGLVSGVSNAAGDSYGHAALWLHGQVYDLGTLGGLNSDIQWPVKNNFGLLAGIAQTGTPDPLGEGWSCAAFFPAASATSSTCLGFVWAWGHMRALPTLGGNNGFAAGANDLGQITGWAENTVHDPSCDTAGSGQVLQFRPVVWGPAPAQIRELPLLSGDSAGAATAINDRGQAVGISGSCDQAVGRYTARHAVLWQNGGVVDLGNLGGVAWHTPMAINLWGHVAGFSNVSASDGGKLHEHAFLWTLQGGMQDLGTLYPDDVHSQATGINARDQVVGLSCTAHFAVCHAFLWEQGRMSDLNSLVGGYDGLLAQALDINDQGEISGLAIDAASGNQVAFIARPDPAGATLRRSAGAMHERAMPAAMRMQLLRRFKLDRTSSNP